MHALLSFCGCSPRPEALYGSDAKDETSRAHTPRADTCSIGRMRTPRRQLVGIMQQQLSELDPSARDELLRSADEARAVIVNRTWVFDSISWFEPRPFDEYPLSR